MGIYDATKQKKDIVVNRKKLRIYYVYWYTQNMPCCQLPNFEYPQLSCRKAGLLIYRIVLSNCSHNSLFTGKSTIKNPRKSISRGFANIIVVPSLRTRHLSI
jgi:hypothetical protein